MESNNYLHIVEQTDEEKRKMYMKCSKAELVSMIIQKEKLESLPVTGFIKANDPPIYTTTSSVVDIDNYYNIEKEFGCNEWKDKIS